MAFRLPSNKKFKPNVKQTPIARKPSIPASLAKPSTPGSSSFKPIRPGPAPSPLQQGSQSDDHADQSGTPSTQDVGMPPGIGSMSASASKGPPGVGSSASQSAPGPTPTPTFREPSIPPGSRKRAASPTPSNASRSSRTGGRPTMIHLAASTGPARRLTPTPSPAPPPLRAIAPAPAPAPTSTPAPAPAPATKTNPAGPPSIRPSQSPAPPTPSAPQATLPDLSPVPPTPSLTFGQPPTIGASRAESTQSTAFPPTISSSQIDPALLDQTPGAGPSRSQSPPTAADTQDTQPTATAEGSSKTGKTKTRAPKSAKASVPRKPRVRKIAPEGPRAESETAEPTSAQPQVSQAESEAGGDGDEGAGTQVDEGDEASAAPPPARKRKPYKPKPLQKDADGNWIRQARAPYKSRGRANTGHDRRLKQNRQARATSQASKTNEDDHDPFAEDPPINPGEVVMGSFASNFYDGDMTERARLLKEAQKTKRDDAQREKLEFERIKRIRLQPLRRRERAKRNEERAARRVQWEAEGAAEGEEEVSDDEQDSTDEEYDFEPDRLTPPGTPEPVYEGQEGEEEEEGIRPDERNPDDEDEEQEGLGLDFDGLREGSAYDEEVEPEHEGVDLNDFGFNVAEGDPENPDDDGGAPRPDDGELNYDDLYGINPGTGLEDDEGAGEGDEGAGFSFADYSANMENRRAQALATQNSRFVVQEDDDDMRMVNSNSWQKRERTDKWTEDETDFFYSVLGEVGENYTMMKAFFPGRSVHQIKKKGLRENAKNPEKVTAAILAKRPIDNSYLRKSAGYDPDRPWDKEEALFAEAKRDMEALRAEDRGEVVGKEDDMVGDPDNAGDDVFDFDRDMPEGYHDDENQEEDQAQDGQDMEQDQDQEVAEGEEGEPETEDNGGGQVQEGEHSGLFIPGGEDDGDAGSP